MNFATFVQFIAHLLTALCVIFILFIAGVFFYELSLDTARITIRRIQQWHWLRLREKYLKK